MSQQNISDQIRQLEGAERAVVRALDATTERVGTIGTTRVEQAIERLQTSCQEAQERITGKLADAVGSLSSLLAFCSSVEDGVLSALSALDVDETESLWPDGVGPLPTLPSDEGQEQPQKARRRTKRLN